MLRQKMERCIQNPWPVRFCIMNIFALLCVPVTFAVDDSQAYVIQSEITVYEEPSLQANPLTTLSLGHIVTVWSSESTKDWIKVSDIWPPLGFLMGLSSHDTGWVTAESIMQQKDMRKVVPKSNQAWGLEYFCMHATLPDGMTLIYELRFNPSGEVNGWTHVAKEGKEVQVSQNGSAYLGGKMLLLELVDASTQKLDKIVFQLLQNGKLKDPNQPADAKIWEFYKMKSFSDPLTAEVAATCKHLPN